MKDLFDTSIQTVCEIYGTLIRDYNIEPNTVISKLKSIKPDLLDDPLVLTVMAHDDTIDNLIEYVYKEIKGE